MKKLALFICRPSLPSLMDLALLVLLLLSHMLPSFMESKFLYLSPSKFGLNLTAYEEVGPIHLSNLLCHHLWIWLCQYSCYYLTCCPLLWKVSFYISLLSTDARDISNMSHVNGYPKHHFLGLLVTIAELEKYFLSVHHPTYKSEPLIHKP